jgi:hypothetical protein
MNIRRILLTSVLVSILVLPLVLITGCPSVKTTVPKTSLAVNYSTPDESDSTPGSDQTTGDLKPGVMVYDGTYSGTFTYVYREGRWSDLKHNWSEPITAELNITITLKNTNSYADWVECKITNVICSDPAFGTGTAGVTPALETYVCLPADPSKGAILASGAFPCINIYFPNGAKLITRPGGLHGLSVSPDGITLYSSGVRDDDGTWTTHYATSGPLALPGVYPVAGREIHDTATDTRYIVDDFLKWSLTKTN